MKLLNSKPKYSRPLVSEILREICCERIRACYKNILAESFAKFVGQKADYPELARNFIQIQELPAGAIDVNKKNSK